MSTLFRDNTTKLADIKIESMYSNINESVSASTGFIEAMIEASERDLKLFEAMLAVDAIELKMKNNGVVNESTIAKLHEASIKKVGETILAGIKWLGSKVVAIKNAIVTAAAKVFDRDIKIVKQYEPIIKQNAEKICEKCKQDNVTSTVYGVNSDNPGDAYKAMENYTPPAPFIVQDAKNKYKESQDEAIAYYCSIYNNPIDKFVSNGKLDSSTALKVPISTAKVVVDELNSYIKVKENIRSINKMYDTFIKGLKTLENSFSAGDYDQDDMVKISKMFGYYNQYALRYCNVAKDFLKLNLQARSKLMHRFVSYAKTLTGKDAKIGTANEGVLDFYDELHDYYIESVFDAKFDQNTKYGISEQDVLEIF